MGCPGSGVNSWASIKKETTWGTYAATPVSFLKLIDESLQMDMGYQALPAATLPDTYMYAGNQHVGGALQPEFHYEDCGLLLQAAFGAVATTGPTETVVYSHKFTFADTLPSLSIQVSKGDIPTGKVFKYTGCKVDQLKLDFKGEDIVRMVASLTCKDEASNVTADGTPAYVYLPVFAHGLVPAFTTIAGAAEPLIVGGGFTINNNLSKNRYFLGSPTIQEQCRDSKRVVEGYVDLQFENLTHYNNFVADQIGSYSFKFESAAIIPGATTLKYLFSMVFASGKMIGETPKVTGPGILEAHFAWRMHGAPSGASTYATLQNKETTIA